MNIAVFCSGNGTNFQALVDKMKQGTLKAEIALMVCDNPQAFVLERAKKEGIRTLLIERQRFASRDEFETEIIKHLEREDIKLICLAGFMRIVGPVLLRKYRNKILNIHPALLPAFKGAHGIKDALDYGVKVTGVTVHVVDKRMDHGPIVLQQAVEVREDDTEESLSRRIHEVEHELYPQAVRLAVEGKIQQTKERPLSNR